MEDQSFISKNKQKIETAIETFLPKKIDNDWLKKKSRRKKL